MSAVPGTSRHTRLWFDNRPAGIAPATVIDFGPIGISGYSNGKLRGNVHVDSEGTLIVRQSLLATTLDLEWEVPRCTDQPDFQYPFEIFVDWPYLSLEWTQGAGATTFFRGMLTAVPL